MKDEKADLTLQFLKARIKTQEDLDNLSNLFTMKGKTKNEKINYICESNHISITTLKRLFDLTYPQAERIIKELLDIKAIVIVGNRYNIIFSNLLKEHLNNKI